MSKWLVKIIDWIAILSISICVGVCLIVPTVQLGFLGFLMGLGACTLWFILVLLVQALVRIYVIGWEEFKAEFRQEVSN